MELCLPKFEDGCSYLSTLRKACLLSQASSESSYNESLSRLNNIIYCIKLEIANLKEILVVDKHELKSLENLKVQSVALVEHLQYTLNNLPARLPQQSHIISRKNEAQQNVEQSKTEVPQPINAGCNYLDFLTKDEFENIPKYMKGRLTYDRVNTIIEQLDKVFTEKYKIRKLKKSALNDVNKKRYDAFRLQENAETKGIKFIVEHDVSDLSSLKVDNVLRNIFTILRHCGLMYEIRGGGYTRLACHFRY